jgi:hypothetical protein
MKKFIFLLLLLPSLCSAQVYELRVYHCNEDKLETLLTRFRNHTLALFEKHGMENIGYWVPAEGKEQVLYYVLKYPSREARETSWKNFLADTEWQEAARKSEENGKILQKIESTFLTLEEGLSAPWSSYGKGGIFELRIYEILPDRYPAIYERFKSHTRALFAKQGMKNLPYYKTETNNLLYFLAHRDKASASAAWDGFRKDPEWIRVRDQSEKDGPIVAKVHSYYLVPTDFSKVK